MKSFVVMNGQYYAGEDTQNNKLNFCHGRANAVAVDQRRVRFIVRTILGWVMSGEIELNRLEILRIGGNKNV